MAPRKIMLPLALLTLVLQPTESATYISLPSSIGSWLLPITATLSTHGCPEASATATRSIRPRSVGSEIAYSLPSNYNPEAPYTLPSYYPTSSRQRTHTPKNTHTSPKRTHTCTKTAAHVHKHPPVVHPRHIHLHPCPSNPALPAYGTPYRDGHGHVHSHHHVNNGAHDPDCYIAQHEHDGHAEHAPKHYPPKPAKHPKHPYYPSTTTQYITRTTTPTIHRLAHPRTQNGQGIGTAAPLANPLIGLTHYRRSVDDEAEEAGIKDGQQYELQVDGFISDEASTRSSDSDDRYIMRRDFEEMMDEYGSGEDAREKLEGLGDDPPSAASFADYKGSRTVGEEHGQEPDQELHKRGFFDNLFDKNKGFGAKQNKDEIVREADVDAKAILKRDVAGDNAIGADTDEYENHYDKASDTDDEDFQFLDEDEDFENENLARRDVGEGVVYSDADLMDGNAYWAELWTRGFDVDQHEVEEPVLKESFLTAADAEPLATDGAQNSPSLLKQWIDSFMSEMENCTVAKGRNPTRLELALCFNLLLREMLTVWYKSLPQ